MALIKCKAEKQLCISTAKGTDTGWYADGAVG